VCRWIKPLLASLLVCTVGGCVGELDAEYEDAPDPPILDAGQTWDAGPRPRPEPGDAGTPPIDAPAPSPDGGAPEARDAGPGDLSAEELDLLRAINDERATRGLSPVEIDMRLQCAARRHARDVGASGSCGHVGRDGSWPWDRAEACGFPQDTWTVNEIAAGPGFDDGADAVWGWSHSSGHYAALTHESARVVGVAVHATCFIALFDCCVEGS